ncbi:hypothetical protein IMZ29_00740 [Achromobacter sp. GG226]|uniref:hypothetical protein n=1 Tax=Verticiella alkaliphila TaxID=2779529 RepID=UPI001C0C90FE|nr:hypothetical protein [Verticiella sp. GG226]MBU4609129.1 hypothetical protein [Verticiella sp. GG226]
MKEGFRKVVRVFGWIAAAIFALFGIALLAQDVLAGGFLLFVAGALLAPPVYGRVNTLAGGRSWAAPVAALLIILILVPIVAVVTQPSPEEAKLLAEARAVKDAEKAEAQARDKAERESKAEKARQDKLAAEQRAAAEKRRRDCSDTTMAFIMSRRFVERQLVAPSTAKFPSSMADGVSSRVAGDCKFQVNAYVDSQNRFGAMLRANYSIDMEYDPVTELWRGTNLRM